MAFDAADTPPQAFDQLCFGMRVGPGLRYKRRQMLKARLFVFQARCWTRGRVCGGESRLVHNNALATRIEGDHPEMMSTPTQLRAMTSCS